MTNLLAPRPNLRPARRAFNYLGGHGLAAAATPILRAWVALLRPLRERAGGHVGPLLRHWRAARRVSQLDLALDADVSSRHLSFVETGRAQPSREMVLRLAEALEVPLRERNALLLAAGYAPLYRETDLGAPEMVEARLAVEFILAKQEPYPAIVVDRHWNLLLANPSTHRFLALFLPGPPAGPVNVMRLMFDPRGVRPFVENWEEVARHLVERLHARRRVRRTRRHGRCSRSCSPIRGCRAIGARRSSTASPRRCSASCTARETCASACSRPSPPSARRKT
jgi:transcriptional regulator with XRE-family HTH domain